MILQAAITGPYLAAAQPLPDLPHPALTRVLTGHTGGVGALVVAPDGSWLASVSWDGTVRIWDPGTGRQRHTLTGHTSVVWALAVAPRMGPGWPPPAGTGLCGVWDPVAGTVRHALTGHPGTVNTLVVAPDGSWLASASYEGTVRIRGPDGSGTP
jgi:WD40 repeat protein